MKSPRTARWLWLLPLLMYFLLTAWSARANSLTIDEGLHIASGYTILRTGDYRLVEEHPPLVKFWIALPLLPLRSLPDPTTLPAWEAAAAQADMTESLPLLQMAQQLLYPHTPTARWLLPARLMEALLGVLLLAILARWGYDLWGWRGGALAVTLAAFDPNLIAHGAIAGTDLGATTFIVLSLFVAQRFLRRPTRAHTLLTGATLGLTLATKLTALLLGPALGLAALWHLWRAPTRAARARLFHRGLLVLAITGATFWAVYGFQISEVPAPGVPFPVPAAAHAIPILRLLGHSSGGHQAYLLGQNSTHGWWYYFPVAFLLKTPLPALILALLALLHKLAQRRPFGHGLAPALFALVYVATSLLSSLNIGYRHLLPLLPLLYLGLGRLTKQQSGKATNKQSGKATKQQNGETPTFYAIRNTQYATRLTLSLLLLWQITGALRIAPYPLSFFNAIAGGPDEGWRSLADSNTDWGQGYQALARFQDAHGIASVRLSAFIFYDPARYGVRHTPLTPLRGDTPAIFPARFAPPPGDYAISATPLDGIPLADPEMYDWFRWRAPDAQIAHALHYYHVAPEESAVTWAAQCITPTAPLDDAALTAGFGREDIRRVDFDCTRSWVIPDGGATPGRYVLHGALLADPLKARLHLSPPPVAEAFVAHHLGEKITYRQRGYRAQPAFAIYDAASKVATVAPPATEVGLAEAGAAPTALVQKPRASAPIQLDGPLAFLGAEFVSGENNEESQWIETWWQVTGAPPDRPISAMGHLLRADGSVIEVADGFDIPATLWQPGDLLIQRHPIRQPPAGEAALFLRTGIYYLDDGARWPVTDPAAPNADAIFIQLRSPGSPGAP